MNKFNIGLDIHGVITSKTAFFREMAKLFVDGGHRVHIITGAHREFTSKELEYMGFEEGIHFTDFFSICDWHKEIGTEITYDKDGNPFLDDELWNLTKSTYCQENNIEFHIDDTPVYGESFTTPFSLFDGKGQTQKVAILGGAFDPVTKMHVEIAQYILDNTECDTVWLLPCFKSLHGKKMSDPQLRLQMLRAATDGLEGIVACDYEIVNELSGKTYDLIHQMREKFWRNDFRFIIGQDNAEGISKWHRSEELINELKFIILPRVGVEQNEDWYLQEPHRFLRDADITGGSSTIVRDLIASGSDEEVLNYIVEPVLDIIKNNGLYIV